MKQVRVTNTFEPAQERSLGRSQMQRQHTRRQNKSGVVFTPLLIIKSFSFIPFHVFRKNNYLPSQIICDGRKKENGLATVLKI
jgi:hypothetical protein